VSAGDAGGGGGDDRLVNASRLLVSAVMLEFKFVYIFSLQQAIHGLQMKETDDTCNLPIKSLSSGPQVAVKVAQERWQAINNKKCRRGKGYADVSLSLSVE
jgi:hypothetical protein